MCRRGLSQHEEGYGYDASDSDQEMNSNRKRIQIEYDVARNKRSNPNTKSLLLDSEGLFVPVSFLFPLLVLVLVSDPETLSVTCRD